MSEQSQITPTMMLRSFLAVGSGYVLSQCLFFGNLLWVGLLFFPEFQAFVAAEEPAQKQMMAENPQAAIPLLMFWLLVVVNAICFLVVGYLVARTAPFSRFQHGVFLAVLLFVFYLQVVIADPAAKKWMDIVYMGALPIAVLQGAAWGSRSSNSPAQ